jgi:hypothetical protein
MCCNVPLFIRFLTVSLSTPPVMMDDSDSNLDWFGFHFLIQAQCMYRRFLESVCGYCRAAYDSVQLPSAGIGYTNEISPLSSEYLAIFAQAQQ